jgi:hypothetical protein
MMMLLQEIDEVMRKELVEFEQANCTVTVEGEKRRINIPGDHFRKWHKRYTRFLRQREARSLVPRSVFVSLVSQYDAFLGRLIKACFRLRPELLNVSERSISFSQLSEFRDIQDAREYVIDKEVETVLRSSHADHFKWMETRFALSLRSGLEIWPQFVEITERRNLFVHADGIVSRQYLSVCREHKYNFGKVVVEGNRLDVTQEYFDASAKCLLELGIKLAHVLWRKILPDDRKRADSHLIELSYSLIDHERYGLACALLDFACEAFKKFSSEWALLALTVNRAQAYKWQGKVDEVTQILGKIDWSAKGDEFKLAHAVLTEDWAVAYGVMKQIGVTGPVKKASYRDWPLFKKLREQPEFGPTYQAVFGEPFVADVSVVRKTTIAKPTGGEPPAGDGSGPHPDSANPDQTLH